MTRKVTGGISLLSALCSVASAQRPVFKELAHLHPPHAYWGVVQGLNGQLYGTSAGVGIGPGQIFEITTGGQLTTLDALKGNSETGLVLATDGNLYGTAFKGGEHGAGMVFRVTPNGTLTRLHNFCAQVGCPDGGEPLGTLIQATDGNLYGTTAEGGGTACTQPFQACGTFFRITLAGKLTTLYTFCLEAGCPDGNGSGGRLCRRPTGTSMAPPIPPYTA